MVGRVGPVASSGKIHGTVALLVGVLDGHQPPGRSSRRAVRSSPRMTVEPVLAERRVAGS